MKKVLILWIAIISFLIVGCSNMGGLLTQQYTKPFITVKDQFQLKLGMREKEVLELLGFPIEIALSYNTTQNESCTIWTYILRYPVYYPLKEGQVSHIKLKMSEQLLNNNPAIGFAEEQTHRLIFINGILVEFGRDGETGNAPHFDLSHNPSER